MLTVPSWTVPGNYYLGVLVDFVNSVTESNEDNNFVSVAFAVSEQPDLVISSGTPILTPSIVAPGEEVTLSAWTVKTQGTVDISHVRLPGETDRSYYTRLNEVFTGASASGRFSIGLQDVKQIRFRPEENENISAAEAKKSAQ